MNTYKHLNILFFICLCPVILHAQTHYVFQKEAPIANFAWDENDTTRYQGHYLYERAYHLIEDMLTDRKMLDFAEAVFAVENCMYDGNLNHSSYMAELERIVVGIKQMATSVTAPSHDMALNYSIYLFYTQPCPLNNYNPYQYDYVSLMENGGLTGGLVTHLLRTGKGTCHSLPYLYKIIAEKVGARAYIANAPLHSYIRHQDVDGKWWNFETTVGGFSRSAFIMDNFHVTENAIRSGLYMTNLTLKETIVQCLYDLLCIYEYKTGFYSNDFVRKCYTLGLQYHYPDNLHMNRINDLKYQLDKEAWNQGFRSKSEVLKDTLLKLKYDYLQQQKEEFSAMGYHAYTPEEYLQKYQEALYYLQKQKSLKSK
jgi:hypothetical protein